MQRYFLLMAGILSLLALIVISLGGRVTAGESPYLGYTLNPIFQTATQAEIDWLTYLPTYAPTFEAQQTAYAPTQEAWNTAKTATRMAEASTATALFEPTATRYAANIQNLDITHFEKLRRFGEDQILVTVECDFLRCFEDGFDELELYTFPFEDCAWLDNDAVSASLNTIADYVWNVNTRELISVNTVGIRHDRGGRWSPDDTLSAHPIGEEFKETGFEVRRSADGLVLNTFEGHTDIVTEIRWASDNRRLASSSLDGTIRVWDALNGELLHVLSGHQGGVMNITWLAGSEYIASAGEDRTVRIWNATTGEQLAVLTGHEDTVTDVAWSPDGTRLASTSKDGTVIIWGMPPQ